MNKSNIDLPVEDIFKGLSNKNITYIKTLLPEDTYSHYSLLESISYLSPQEQWDMDIFLNKARLIQIIRITLKRIIFALTISLIFITIILKLSIM